MPDRDTMLVFLTATFALLVVPGPAVLFIVARAVEQGRGAAVASAAGISAGSLVHVAAAVLGLSALVASSATAFAVVKWAGAAYLVVMGVRTLLAPAAPGAEVASGPAPALPRIALQGMAVQVLNPKIALFFLAFLPQFVDPARGDVAAQTLVLGCILVGMGLCTDAAWGLLASGAGAVLRGHAAWARVQRYVAGTVFILLGITAAFTGSHRAR